jgi:hypothetical protein
MARSLRSRVLGQRVPDDSAMDVVTWPFPNKPPEHEPLDKLPFNPDNEEDAPL